VEQVQKQDGDCGNQSIVGQSGAYQEADVCHHSKDIANGHTESHSHHHFDKKNQDKVICNPIQRQRLAPVSLAKMVREKPSEIPNWLSGRQSAAALSERQVHPWKSAARPELTSERINRDYER